MSSSPLGSPMDPLDPLDRHLRALPAIRASSGFAERVLRKLAEPTPVWTRIPAPGLAAIAAAACLLLVVSITVVLRHVRAPEPDLHAVASSIRRDHALLTEELDRLRTRTETTAPILYLGSDEQIDYVLDLSPFLLPQAGAVLPASNPESTNAF